jgi:murein DD-endopeptidase MepM/ murein hydrolase activator NlpD
VTAANADGNSVVLDLGDGHFALYAHFQPGSLRVRLGERVRRGQVLGLVGNSGNSDAAHLHFHVMDGPSPLASNGLPYVIDRFEVTGQAVSSSDLDAELRNPLRPVRVRPVPGPSLQRNRLPADLQVVRFLP